VHPPPHEDAHAGDDVFVLVKQWMADGELSQPPLLVVPTCLFSDATKSLEDINNSKLLDFVNIEPARSKDLLKLARFLEMNYKVFHRSVVYIKALANMGGTARPRPLKLQFLTHGKRTFEQRADLKVHFEDAIIPRQLQVQFRNTNRGPDLE
jgi:hypothetical protein